MGNHSLIYIYYDCCTKSQIFPNDTSMTSYPSETNKIGLLFQPYVKNKLHIKDDTNAARNAKELYEHYQDQWSLQQNGTGKTGNPHIET